MRGAGDGGWGRGRSSGLVQGSARRVGTGACWRYGMTVRGVLSAAGLPEPESQLHRFLDVWPGASNLTPLCLIVLICKM